MSSDKATLLKIGRHIAELRKEKGYTQKSLSDVLYVGEKTVSKWERGVVAPDITMIKTLSDLFEVSVDELLSGEKIDNSKNDNNEATIDAINVYTKQTKHNVIKKSILSIGIVLLITLTVFLIDRHYKWKINKFKIDGEFQIYGYSFENNIETKIIIDKIAFDDPNAGTDLAIKTNYLKLSIFSGNEEICNDEKHYENKEQLFLIFNKYSFVCENDDYVNTSDLSLHIDFDDNNELTKKKFLLK